MDATLPAALGTLCAYTDEGSALSGYDSRMAVRLYVRRRLEDDSPVARTGPSCPSGPQLRGRSAFFPVQGTQHNINSFSCTRQSTHC